MYERDDLVDALLVDNSTRRRRQKNLDIRVIVGNPPYSVGQKSENDNNDNIEYPTKYVVGDKLKDASVKGTGQSGPMAITFDMLVRNRSVEGQEKITVPSGTYDAYKIKSEMAFEMKMGFPVRMEMESISYRAPGVLWDLKTETYRKGKLIGYSELTKIY